MDKSDWALLIASASALFTAWQGYSAHVSAKISRQSARRKAPAFEIDCDPSRDFEGWLSVNVTARNFEPVAVQIEQFRYLKRGTVLLHPDAEYEERRPTDLDPTRVDALPETQAARTVQYHRTLGPGGSQEYRGDAPHMPRATIYMRLFAKGSFDPKHLHVDWQWADGQKK